MNQEGESSIEGKMRSEMPNMKNAVEVVSNETKHNSYLMINDFSTQDITSTNYELIYF